MTFQLVRRLGLLVGIVVVFMVAGCATLDPQAVQSQTRGKRIAVASVLGPRLALQWVGTTTLNNEAGTIDVSPWGIDEQAAKAIGSRLEASRRYAAVSEVTGVSREGSAVPRLPAGTTADFLVLIQPYDEGDPMFGTKLTFAGLGVAQRSVLGLQLLPTRAHVGIKIELFDLAAGKSMGAGHRFVHWPVSFALKPGAKPAGWDSVATPRIEPSDLAALRQPMMAKLDDTIAVIVGETGLR